MNDTKNSLTNFLYLLENSGIPYVSWKNSHEIESALDGRSDLDIFVPLQFRHGFFSLARQNGWLRLQNPVADFPWVSHIYNALEEGKTYHIHVYFKLITGESWIKEYCLPLQEFLLEGRIKSAKNGIFVSSSTAQAYIFAIRHLLKCGSFTSRLLYKKELVSYRQEWLSFGCKIDDLRGIGPIMIDSYLRKSGLGTDFKMPVFFHAVLFRMRLYPSLRLPVILLPVFRTISFTKRILNKFVYKRKKTFVGEGLIIAVSGVDGAGKSSLVQKMSERFADFLTVNRSNLGKPQGKYLQSLLDISTRLRKYKKNDSESSKTTKQTGILSACTATYLALLRLRKARACQRSARRGGLVIVDRWPTHQIGMMDGPKLVNTQIASVVGRKISAIECWAYNQMPEADICIFLEVPLETALKRNRERIKEGKETDLEIEERYTNNRSVTPKCAKLIWFNNEGELEKKFNEIFSLTWEEIIEHQA